MSEAVKNGYQRAHFIRPSKIKGVLRRELPYCGDSVIIIAVIFIIIIIISISILSLLQKNTSREIVGLNLKKILLN